MASIRLLAEVQGHQQVLRAPNVARSRHNRNASLHDLLPNLLILPLPVPLQRNTLHPPKLGSTLSMDRRLRDPLLQLSTHPLHPRHPPKGLIQNGEIRSAVPRQRNVRDDYRRARKRHRNQSPPPPAVRSYQGFHSREHPLPDPDPGLEIFVGFLILPSYPAFPSRVVQEGGGDLRSEREREDGCIPH